MRGKLERRYGLPQLHFVTFSCVGRLPLLRAPDRRDTFLRVLADVRRKHRFQIHGYVVMPEHVHLLLSEPKTGTPATVLQVLKQRVSAKLLKDTPELGGAFWERRFYDFNVWSLKKRIEKLNYMHMNPVARGLVDEPGAWTWSSFRFYQYREETLCTPDRFNPDERAPVGRKRNSARN